MTARRRPTLDQWLRSVYGGTDERAVWARRAADAFLAGEAFAEPMPRDRYNVGGARLEGIRRAVVEELTRLEEVL
jgi:hypothetical protein